MKTLIFYCLLEILWFCGIHWFHYIGKHEFTYVPCLFSGLPHLLELLNDVVWLTIISVFIFGNAGYNDSTATRYSTQPQFVNSTSRPQFDNSPYTSNELVGNSNQVHVARNDNSSFGLALGPPQASSSGFQALGSSMQESNLNPFDWSNNRDKGVDDFFSEDEIRMRSHEMLENEDMQQLLRMFSMGGHASVNVHDEGFSFPSFMPSPMPSFDDRNRSGKAVVGWLKIKAAMRWGFFIRKKAAERRAQIVELDDE